MKIGPYEIEGEIARGGQGVVFRARDPVQGFPVAIKVLSERQDERQRKRFQREAQALGKLDHPNIVRVLNVGEDREQAYLVLEFVEGPSLQDRLDREGPLPPTEAARITQVIADAVQFAHGLSIVHRDIKPSNVLMRGDTPLLTDFGLARELDAPMSGSVSVQGRFMGTPGFCPPEQARGELDRLGPPADVYGLGALLYALLTGDPPFMTESLLELLVATVETPPLPPSSRGVDVHPDLEAVCLRCLEKAPEDRYTSAWELSQDLERVLAGRAPGWRSSQSNPTLPPRPNAELEPVAPVRVALVLLVGLLLLAALGGGVAVGLIAILDSGEDSTTVEPAATPAPTATARVAWDPAALAALQGEADRVAPYQEGLAAQYAALADQAGDQRATVEAAFVDYLINRGHYDEAKERVEVVRRAGALSPTLRLLETVAENERVMGTGKQPGPESLQALVRDLAGTPAGLAAEAILANSAGRHEDAARLARLARQRDPTLGIAWAEEVRGRIRSRDLEQARALAVEALQRRPADVQVLVRAAQAEMFVKRSPRSVELVERCLTLFGPDLPRHVAIAAVTVYSNAKHYERALKLIARLDPDQRDFALRFRAGIALYALGRPIEGRRIYAQLHASDPAAFKRTAQDLLTAEDAGMVIGAMTSIRRTRRDSPRLLRFRIAALGPQVLPSMVQRASGAPASVRRTLVRALMLAASGERWAEIKPVLEAAREAAPRSPTVAREFARLAVGRDELEDARAALARARDLVRGEARWELEHLEAKLELQAGLRPAATARLRKLARGAEGIARDHARALLKLLGHDPQEARRLLERALRGEPDHVDARSTLVVVLNRLAPKEALALARALHAKLGASDEHLITSWIVGAMEHMFREFEAKGMSPRLLAAGIHLAQETEYLFLISGGAAARLRICDQYLRFSRLRSLPPRVPQWMLETLREADRRDPRRGSALLLIGMLGVRMGEPATKILRRWREALRREPTLEEPRDFTRLFLRRYPAEEAALRELWPR